MERPAALALTSRIEANWSNGRWSSSLLREWTDALETLDEGAAGTAMMRLRNQGKPTLSIPEFIATTRSLHTVDAGNRPDPCDTCADSGWIDAPDRIWDNDRHSTQVAPCRCPQGRQRAGSRIWTERNRPERTVA